MTRGQTLIEVLIAMAMGLVVVSAITIAVISALNNAQFSKNQNLATQYAQEGMEVARRAKNSNNLLVGNYNYCLAGGSTTLELRLGGSCGQNINNFFVREVDTAVPLSDPCPNQLKATVFVQWKDSKCTGANFCNEVRLVSCFSDFNVVPTP